jgi:hypothetical protein
LVSFLDDQLSPNTENEHFYDGSFKSDAIQFYTLLDTVKNKKHLNIHYTGEVTTKPIVKDNFISYSLNVTSLQTTYSGSDKVVYYVADRNALIDKEMAMEVTLFTKDQQLYLMLGFPENNAPISQHPVFINLIKP